MGLGPNEMCFCPLNSHLFQVKYQARYLNQAAEESFSCTQLHFSITFKGFMKCWPENGTEAPMVVLLRATLCLCCIVWDRQQILMHWGCIQLLKITFVFQSKEAQLESCFWILNPHDFLWKPDQWQNPAATNCSYGLSLCHPQSALPVTFISRRQTFGYQFVEACTFYYDCELRSLNILDLLWVLT